MNKVQPQDAELIARVVQRNRDALALLYDRYANLALGLAVKIVGERTIGEEVVQEAFWRVWQRAATFNKERGSFSSWLFGIVYHLAIDELRRRRGQPARVELREGTEYPSTLRDTTEVVDHVWSNVRSGQIRTAVTQLPDPQRTVIEMAYFEGLTRQEIAERLHEPLGTIHTRARLALLKLRDSLADLGASEP
jgi:RNA polymerase sigma-70 factor, ECF subfamily